MHSIELAFFLVCISISINVYISVYIVDIFYSTYMPSIWEYRDFGHIIYLWYDKWLSYLLETSSWFWYKSRNVRIILSDQVTLLRTQILSNYPYQCPLISGDNNWYSYELHVISGNYIFVHSIGISICYLVIRWFFVSLLNDYNWRERGESL